MNIGQGMAANGVSAVTIGEAQNPHVKVDIGEVNIGEVDIGEVNIGEVQNVGP